jgi:acetylornithine deacetylase
MDEVTDILKKLIAMNTVSPESTQEIADFISNYLEGAGFAIEHQTYHVKRVNKVNVIAQKGVGDLRLALSGHMDTVPFDKNEWRTDPLQLTKIEDKYFGMGTCDMKGFIALAMVAGSRISVDELQYPFGLVFTSDEEVGCIGAKRLVREKGRIADMIIIGEPTELCPFTMHKGYMYIAIELRGKRGHSSRPDEGINVVERALVPVLQKINEFKVHLGEIEDMRFDPPYPTLNIGVVSTGDNAAKNIIADYCRIELDIRPIPGQNVSEIFRAFVAYMTEGNPSVNGVEIKIGYARAPTVPMETDVTAHITKEVEAMSGQTACSTSFNTEGGVFNASGAKSVICGLGSIQQAHRPNEFVHESYLAEDVVAKYASIIKRICGRR